MQERLSYDKRLVCEMKNRTLDNDDQMRLSTFSLDSECDSPSLLPLPEVTFFPLFTSLSLTLGSEMIHFIEKTKKVTRLGFMFKKISIIHKAILDL